MDTVSVIIPAYNSEHTIERALDSVFKQTYLQLEIIIINDCSTDHTLTILSKYSDIKVLSFNTRKGAAAARNAGIKESKGKYIAFLDADDEWLPEKTEMQINLFRKKPSNLGLVTCNSMFDGLDGRYGECDNYFLKYPPYRGDRAWIELMKFNFIVTPTVMIRSDVFSKVGMFNENLKVSEDFELWLRIANRFSIDYLDDILVNFHYRPNSLSSEIVFEERIKITLNIVNKFFDENISRISKEDANDIFGMRYFDFAYSTYTRQNYFSSLKYCLKTLSYRYRFIKTITIFIRSILKIVFLNIFNRFK